MMQCQINKEIWLEFDRIFVLKIINELWNLSDLDDGFTEACVSILKIVFTIGCWIIFEYSIWLNSYLIRNKKIFLK